MNRSHYHSTDQQITQTVYAATCIPANHTQTVYEPLADQQIKSRLSMSHLQTNKSNPDCLCSHLQTNKSNPDCLCSHLQTNKSHPDCLCSHLQTNKSTPDCLCSYFHSTDQQITPRLSMQPLTDQQITPRLPRASMNVSRNYLINRRTKKGGLETNAKHWLKHPFSNLYHNWLRHWCLKTVS